MTSLEFYRPFRLQDPFRPPDWRWRRVQEICNPPGGGPPSRSSRRDDIWVVKTRNFLMRWRACTSDLERRDLYHKMPSLTIAYRLFERDADEPQALIVQARLLARQTAEVIAQGLGTFPEAILWYESLFFNVTPYLNNTDWITSEVLLPALASRRPFPLAPVAGPGAPPPPAPPLREPPLAQPFLDGSLKYLAYFGGPLFVDLLIQGVPAGQPLASAGGLPAWLDQMQGLILRRRSLQAALQFDVNKYNVMQLFELHAKIIEVENSAEAGEARQTEVDRHVKAMIDSIPWAVGEGGRRVVAGTQLEKYDEGSMELRDDEVQAAAMGQLDPSTIADRPTSLPPPRPREANILTDTDAELI
jgi:hypothetical protein